MEEFDWLSFRRKVCFVQGQDQKYGQKYETKELVKFRNHLHALTTDAGTSSISEKSIVFLP